MGDTDGDGWAEQGIGFDVMDVIDNREPILFHLFQRCIVRNKEIRIVTEPSQIGALVLEIIKEFGTNLGDEVGVFVLGLSGDILIVINHYDADNEGMVNVNFIDGLIIGDVAEDE